MAHSRPLPNYVKKGDPIAAATINAIIDVLRSLDMSPGPGISIKRSSNGMSISIRALETVTGGGGGGSSVASPFDIAWSAGSDVSHATATIRVGTLNGLIPSNMADTYDVAIAGTFYLVLHATATDGQIDGATLSVESVAPGAIPVLLGTPPAAFDILIGVIVNGVWFRVLGSGSITATGDVVFLTDKATPTPGTLPYDSNYTWLVLNA